ncbi:MAG: antibiotic biosynthesis monooxygenase [Cyclobacteriaceae bacterium]|nr:antibiotic biosynthesis monooxygenase [Cyclobacteriaceae bacterium]
MDNQTVYVIARWKVKAGNLPVVLEALKKLAEQTRAEEGNELYRAHQLADDDHVILLYEIYKDAQAAQAHRDSTHFQALALGTIVPLLEERQVMRVKPFDF